MDLSVDQCKIDLRVCSTKLKVYVTTLGTYDLVIGMDWLEAHQAWVDCYGKRILSINDEGEVIQIQGIKRKVSLRCISAMKMKRCLRKGCRAYIIQEVSKEKGPSFRTISDISRISRCISKGTTRITPRKRARPHNRIETWYSTNF